MKEKMGKPVGAIISGGKGTPRAKVAAFEDAGVAVAEKPDEIPGLMREALGR